MSRTEKIFFYGSLLQQTGNRQVDRIISRFARPLYRGYMHGKLYNISDYPGVLESGIPSDKVYGVLYELSRAAFCLPLLDRYEDYREKQPELGEYIRKQVEVYKGGTAGSVLAWCYIYNRPCDERNLIRNGDWLSFASQKVL